MAIPVPCSKCDGEGTMECPTCKQRATKRNPFPELFCALCSGTNDAPCDVCGGSGYEYTTMRELEAEQ